MGDCCCNGCWPCIVVGVASVVAALLVGGELLAVWVLLLALVVLVIVRDTAVNTVPLVCVNAGGGNVKNGT